MTVEDPRRPPPCLEQEAAQAVTAVEVTKEKVVCLLRGVGIRKATGPDDVSPRTLKHCTSELAGTLFQVFKDYLEENTWPSVWKEAQVMPVHKSARMESRNYRPISFLPVVSKVFERVVADEVCRYLDDNLLSNQQFGFRAGQSTSDLLLLPSHDWQDALDGSLDTLVVALDIAGAFDRVWYAGLLEKLHAKGIQGDLLHLLSDYLPMLASVPQGSVLDPILWNLCG